MEYSPIKSIRVKNFNCIGDVEMTFSDAPIIAITGDNDAGKSSFIDGFACLTYHANERNQKDSIRDGTTAFGVETHLDDGTCIIRTKSKRANRFEVTYPDGSNWSADKLEAGAGAPKPVQEVMGCIKEEETKEFLHIRTYRDQVLFVNTTAGTNYKVMYSALKAQHISNAITKGTAELNKLKGIKNESEIVLDTYLEQYNSINIYDTEPLVGIRDRVNKHQKAIILLEEAMVIKTALNEAYEEQRKYKALDKHKLGHLDMNLINRLMRAKTVVDDFTKLQEEHACYKQVKRCGTVDLEKLEKLKSAIAHKTQLKEYQPRHLVLRQVNKCEPAEINAIAYLEKAIVGKQTLDNLQSEAKKYKHVSKLAQADASHLSDMTHLLNQIRDLQVHKQKHAQLEQRKTELNNAIADSGVKMATCGNCGHMVYVD